MAAMLTHNDPASTAACVALIAMLCDLLTCERTPDADWWVERYFSIADQLENAYDYRHRFPGAPEHEGRICDYVMDQVPPVLEQGLTVREACDRWGSGAYLLETMPSVLFILSRHGDNPVLAIRRAVNDTLDNDTHAAIVGAAIGALHGTRSLPAEWRKGLLGQLRGGDDGEVHRLIGRVKRRWWLET
jgi:ADP-ribosylglycohydrolase